MQDQQQQDPNQQDRYVVKVAPDNRGYHILDATSKDQPYTINAMRSREYEHLSPELIAYYQEHNRTVAQEWADTWNLVERGHCGGCKELLATVPGHANERYAAVGYNSMHRVFCFYCSCSNED